MADEQTSQPLESFSDLRAALGTPATPLDPTGAPKAPETPVTPPAPLVAPAAPVAPETPAPVAPVEPPAVDKKPKRFSELTRELEATRQREADLAAQLAAAKSAPATPPPAAATPLPEAEGKPTPPDANTWDKSWPELEVARAKYTEELVAWSLKNDRLQRSVEAARESALAAARSVQERWDTAYDAAASADDTVVDAVKHVGEAIKKIPGIIDVIKDSEVGLDIVRELHADADSLAKLSKMGIAAAAREIGKIEAFVLGKKAAAKPATAPTEPLPAPPTNVGGGASGHSTGPDVNKLGEMPMSAFKETIGKMLTGKKALKADRRGL